jgi:hypothetical protein
VRENARECQCGQPIFMPDKIIYLFDIRDFFSIFQCRVADTVDTAADLADTADTAFRKRRRIKGEGPGS